MTKLDIPQLTALILLVVVSYLGAMKFFLDGSQVYLADYLLRAFLIGFFVLTFGMNGLFKGQSRLKDVFWASGIIIVLLVLEKIVTQTEAAENFDSLLFDPVGFPKIENDLLLKFDLTLGLILVSLSEESIFRVAFVKIAEVKNWPVTKLYVLSTLLFAFMHFPQGLVGTVTAAVFGLVLMYFYRRTQSFLFVVVAHTLVNVWFFAPSYF
ncbi:CPBP family intramembrane glutamic endopeptidase [Terasakiella sp. A23]|nr:CPBP family intramembrane glutamic endopeptidase [Terasakiella sp. A23]